MTQAEIAYRETLEETQEQEQLILKELPQVYYIARRIYDRLPQHVPFEDLVHAGVIGLIEAIRSYDSKKSVPLRAFAKFRIRGAILDSLRELDWGSRPLRRQGRRIEEAIATLSTKLGRQPEEEEIAAQLDITIAELHETAVRLDGLVLIGQEVNSGYDRSEKQDLIETAPSREEGPDDLCFRQEIRDQLAQAIETLSEKEQMVISLYYKEELTMKEIAAVLQLAESRVSQIHALAIPKLRAALRKGAFDEKNAQPI
ncbi:MAG TPA: FliA/WhiG family RNA polymerase sigma factor [Terriglobales bacterium]|nr:FliA/WhiG family RNA polymerase sigma factor [Terriglobales bacterium]